LGHFDLQADNVLMTDRSNNPSRTKLNILAPGLHTMVVDLGRPNSRHLGVPVGGAADKFSLAIGNALVGNTPDAAALEITLLGPTVEAEGNLSCVLFGAPFSLGCERQELDPNKTFTLQAGERLQIAGAPQGACGYLCIQGGIQTPWVLGSRSGFAPLPAGLELPCYSKAHSVRFLPNSFSWNQEPKTLRVLAGMQADWFNLGFFVNQEYQISPVSNRMGLRLLGKPLPVSDHQLLSEPVSPGSVQVTRDGQCIILGVDGQTIGGYPKIAQVISADIDKLGQLRPGDWIRFVRITLEEAETVWRQKKDELDEWITRLLETSV
jgi:antagonist of KipI